MHQTLSQALKVSLDGSGEDRQGKNKCKCDEFSKG